MELWGKTDCGKVRRQNQDVFEINADEDNGVAAFLVCDGMGGVRAGNVASKIASEVFMENIGGYLAEAWDLADIAVKMADAVFAANKAVYEKSLTGDEYHGMGTTLTAAISTVNGEVIINVGDSRGYYITPSGIKQITKDHTVVEDMVSRGDLTRAQARRHPKKNLITRAVGTSDQEEPDVFFLNLAPGEHILLCSDGFSNLVMDSEVLFELQQGKNIRESCESLVETALSRGAPDNVTAVIFKK